MTLLDARGPASASFPAGREQFVVQKPLEAVAPPEFIEQQDWNDLYWLARRDRQAFAAELLHRRQAVADPDDKLLAKSDINHGFFESAAMGHPDPNRAVSLLGQAQLQTALPNRPVSRRRAADLRDRLQYYTEAATDGERQSLLGLVRAYDVARHSEVLLDPQSVEAPTLQEQLYEVTDQLAGTIARRMSSPLLGRGKRQYDEQMQAYYRLLEQHTRQQLHSYKLNDDRPQTPRDHRQVAASIIVGQGDVLQQAVTERLSQGGTARLGLWLNKGTSEVLGIQKDSKLLKISKNVAIGMAFGFTGAAVASGIGAAVAGTVLVVGARFVRASAARDAREGYDFASITQAQRRHVEWASHDLSHAVRMGHELTVENSIRAGQKRRMRALGFGAVVAVGGGLAGYGLEYALDHGAGQVVRQGVTQFGSMLAGHLDNWPQFAQGITNARPDGSPASGGASEATRATEASPQAQPPGPDQPKQLAWANNDTLSAAGTKPAFAPIYDSAHLFDYTAQGSPELVAAINDDLIVSPVNTYNADGTLEGISRELLRLGGVPNGDFLHIQAILIADNPHVGADLHLMQGEVIKIRNAKAAIIDMGGRSAPGVA